MSIASPLTSVSRLSRVTRQVAVTTVVSLLPVTGLAVATSSPVAAQESSDSLKEKAAAIAAKREELHVRMSQLDEEYNVARLKLEELKQVAAATSSELKAARRQYAEAQGQIREYAVKNFISANGNGMVQGGDITEAMRKRTYLQSRAGDREAVADQMRAASGDLAERQQVVDDTSAQIEVEQDRAEKAKAGLAAAEKELANESVIVDKKLQQALAAEEAARRKAAEARARREAAAAAAAAQQRRQAAAAAIRRPVASGGSSSGDSSSSDDSSSSGSGNGGGGGASVVEPAPSYTPPPTAGGGGAVSAALTRVGLPYRWAAEGPDAFDCSGLIVWAFRQAGRGGLPHSSRALYAMGTPISVSELRPGDLVAYGSPIHHIGIYIGNEQYVHAPQTGDRVKVSSIYRSAGSPRPVRI